MPRTGTDALPGIDPHLSFANVSLANLAALEALSLSCGIYYDAPAPPRTDANGVDAAADDGNDGFADADAVAAPASDVEAAPADDGDAETDNDTDAAPANDDAGADAAGDAYEPSDDGDDSDDEPQTVRTLHRFPLLWEALSSAPPSLKEVTFDIMASQSQLLKSFSEPKGGVDWARLQERLLALPNLETVVLFYRLADPAVKDETSERVDVQLMECMPRLRAMGKVVVHVPARVPVKPWSCGAVTSTGFGLLRRQV